MQEYIKENYIIIIKRGNNSYNYYEFKISVTY